MAVSNLTSEHDSEQACDNVLPTLQYSTASPITHTARYKYKTVFHTYHVHEYDG